MNKRAFIKLSSSLLAMPFISSFKSWAQAEKIKNWAGNLEYSTDRIDYPTSVEEVQQLVKKYSKYNFISLKQMNKVVALDTKASNVTIEGGMKYGDLCPWLNDKGFALPNLASLPHISVAGACTTATHGSGVKNGNLATSVTAL